jgi:hypothetical protein
LQTWITGAASFDCPPCASSGRTLRMRRVLYAIEDRPHPELAPEGRMSKNA